MNSLAVAQGFLVWLGGQAIGWGSGILLLSVRVGAFLLLSPVFYAVPMPAPARMLVGLALTVVLSAGLVSTTAAAIPQANLFQSAIGELVLGAMMALGVLLAFSAFSVAGQLLDVQIGFGIAQVFDPATQRQVSVLNSIYKYAGVLLFFVLEGHHALLRGLAYSVELFPVGGTFSPTGAAQAMISHASASFALGFMLAAPVVFCVLLTEFALGVIARNLPQVNMFTLGIPIKIVVGLLALSVWMSGMGAVMGRVYERIPRSWSAMFTGMLAVPPAAPR